MTKCLYIKPSYIYNIHKESWFLEQHKTASRLKKKTRVQDNKTNTSHRQ